MASLTHQQSEEDTLRNDARKVLQKISGKRPGKPCGKTYIAAEKQCGSHSTKTPSGKRKLTEEGKAAAEKLAARIRARKGMKPKQPKPSAMTVKERREALRKMYGATGSGSRVENLMRKEEKRSVVATGEFESYIPRTVKKMEREGKITAPKEAASQAKVKQSAIPAQKMKESEKLPLSVRNSLDAAINPLKQLASKIESARQTDRSFGGDGRYEAEAIGSQKSIDDAIRTANKTIDKFKELAPKNGINADKVLREMGLTETLKQLELSSRAKEWMGESRAAQTQVKTAKVPGMKKPATAAGLGIQPRAKTYRGRNIDSADSITPTEKRSRLSASQVA